MYIFTYVYIWIFLRVSLGRRTQLWDLEEGGPTDADQGFNYNPVVIDDAVSRRGYPALVTGWREWGCDGDKESLETEYACVNHPDNHGADYDDDYWYDAYGKGGRYTGHFTEDLDVWARGWLATLWERQSHSNVHTHAHTRTHVRIHTHAYTHTHFLSHTHTHIHTYTHTSVGQKVHCFCVYGSLSVNKQGGGVLANARTYNPGARRKSIVFDALCLHHWGGRESWGIRCREIDKEN